jgi:hypothetical protein
MARHDNSNFRLGLFQPPTAQYTHSQREEQLGINALKVASVPRLPIYQCRHTFATRLSAAGVSDTIIDQLLGHSRRDVLRFYTARVPEYLRDAISNMDKFRRAKTESLKLSGVDAIMEGTSKGINSNKLNGVHGAVHYNFHYNAHNRSVSFLGRLFYLFENKP